VAAVLFALAVVSLHRFPAAAAAFTMALGIALGSGLTVAVLIRRLLALEGFLLVLLLTLPFTLSGETVFTLGSLNASREGVQASALILLKANAVILVLLALVGGLEPVVFGHALARLGVPRKLVHLLLFTVRQIHLLQREYLRLRQAMRARAFVPRSNRHTWNSFAYLMGMLLLRSVERARRVLAAMRCRGFDGRLYLLNGSRWGSADTLGLLGFGLLAAGLPILDRCL
jgi:cobalt/nickel transport system permease protein